LSVLFFFFIVASRLLAIRWRIHSAGNVRCQNTTQILGQASVSLPRKHTRVTRCWCRS